MTNWLQSFHQQLPSANQFWRNSRHRQHWQDIFLISCIVVVYIYETIRQEVDSGEPRHRSTVAKDWNNQQTRNITTRKWMIKPLHLRLWPKWSCLNAWRVVFSMECLEFLSSMVAKIMERSALKSSVTHAASCLVLSEWRNWHKSWGITAITVDRRHLVTCRLLLLQPYIDWLHVSQFLLPVVWNSVYLWQFLKARLWQFSNFSSKLFCLT